MRRRRRGLTLLELLLSLCLMAVLASAISYAFVAGTDMQRLSDRRRSQRDDAAWLEQRITRLLEGARLTDDTTDAMTYFVGETSDGGDPGELGCDVLTFTTVAPGVPMAAQRSDDDFETQYEQRGPVGGVAEVCLSTTPTGDSGGRTGLFERVQRPADGDYTQGGLERALAASVSAIGFQFYNGTEWVDTWNTVVNGERRLPAAVLVQYALIDDEEGIVRTLVVPIPGSDVTETNPSTNGAVAN